MTCPKCHHENSEGTRFCRRCHMTLRFSCPACNHLQAHGGACDRCGVDFLKYAMMMQSQMASETHHQRERTRACTAAVRQVFLLPLTGGYSLIKYVRSLMQGE